MDTRQNPFGVTATGVPDGFNEDQLIRLLNADQLEPTICLLQAVLPTGALEAIKDPKHS